jgi:hypothetical protein
MGPPLDYWTMPPEAQTKRNRRLSSFYRAGPRADIYTAAHGESDCVHNRIFCEPDYSTTRARGNNPLPRPIRELSSGGRNPSAVTGGRFGVSPDLADRQEGSP